jgi:hypothetical protein
MVLRGFELTTSRAQKQFADIIDQNRVSFKGFLSSGHFEIFHHFELVWTSITKTLV